ncbi:tryptophan synthase beta subunit-like PLP-dependent enzyme [Pisolithus thermaeus]|nr:tryptophan synthase beta subunit-like PLP-dependent enzyme [Pisolithus thermaeus]
MRYFSTRGGNEELSFEEVVLAGLAPDGGLYIPTEIPKLPENWEDDWSELSYQDLAIAILSLFISSSELSREDITELVYNTYAYPQKFRNPLITPLVPLSEKRYILELFHGPTYAFKDLALQLLGNLFEFFLRRRNMRKAPGEPAERLTVVGATSGDTGSAAIYGLRNKANISIFILFPRGRVSEIQEAQMTTVMDENVHNVRVAGTFDDSQDIVKTLFSDKEFNERHSLAAVNSINWARILVQIVYYFSAYFQLKQSLASSGTSVKPDIQFVVPTGNFGDILAGYYAKRMMLPMRKLGIATNANDILTRFWKTGRYAKVDPSTGVGVRETLSPAMDITVSSNFERLLWYLAYQTSAPDDPTRRITACKTVAGWMERVKKEGQIVVPDEVLRAAREDFVAEKVDDAQITNTILEYYEGSPSYIPDPHTAVGLHVAASVAKAEIVGPAVQVILATAHPAKFSAAVNQALGTADGFDFDRDVLPHEFRDFLTRERRVIDVDRPDVGLVRDTIETVVQERV